MVRHANRQHALTQIEASLRSGAQIFEKLIAGRNRQITEATEILSRDHAFQQAFAGAEGDRATTLSALASLQSRVKADEVLICSLEKELLFDTRRPDLHGASFPFPRLIDRAEKTESTYSFVLLDNDLFVMAVAPLLAPDPIAWLCPAFQIDDQFAAEIKTYTNLDVTFFSESLLFATTFPRRHADMQALRHDPAPLKQIIDLKVAGEDFLSYSVPLTAENGHPVALLQRSLDKELEPYRQLEHTYLFLALLGLAVSAVLGTWIARGMSRPVLQLAEGAHQIAAGNYEHRVHVKQADELGLLASSFNHMSEGLADRDRVRDLLGKVVSPEVASELLQRGVALGGEEREVTILFSDLRNFTSMSESIPPQEMLSILNHYFTRMSAIVEKHGGVVDKYMGDGLMALFGAPITSDGDADRALNAAWEMTEALDQLNQEWEKRGLPAVEVGIGVNTDVVIAGNMGSERRVNYTVIGDGVNLASRLEGLTKTPEYQTRIIVTASALERAGGQYRTRRLGEVAVKGKQNTTEIFALLGRGEIALAH